MKKFLFALLFLPFVCLSQRDNIRLVSYTTEYLEPSYGEYEVVESQYQTVLINLNPFNVEFVDVDDDYSASYTIEFFEHIDGVSYYSVNGTTDIFLMDYNYYEISVFIDFNQYTEEFQKVFKFSDIINLDK